MRDETILRIISEKYDEYLARFEEEGLPGTAIGGIGDKGSRDSVYPLEASVKTETTTFIGTVETPLERECLFSYYDTIPAPSEMSTGVLEKLPIQLLKILRVQISPDNRSYWSHTYQTFRSLSGETEFIEKHIWHNIAILFNLALAEPQPSAGHHTTAVLFQRPLIAGYVSYPIFEGLLRYLIPDLKMDGTVLSDNTVRNFKEEKFYERGDRCNRLTDALVHFEESIASEGLARGLSDMRDGIAKFGKNPSHRSYKTITNWRNSITHGQVSSDVQYGIVLNLICMILWNRINEFAEPE